jgi:hypothetical protein
MSKHRFETDFDAATGLVLGTASGLVAQIFAPTTELEATTE